MNQSEPVRQASVQGRDIFVFDGLVPDSYVAIMAAALDAGPFKKSESARRETAEHKHWAAEFAVEDARKLPLFRAAQRAVEQSFGTSYEMFRSYCNLALYGDMLFTHCDCGPQEKVVTALWYLCAKWDVEWGGETLFFDDTGDARFVVTPRPGRLVLFDGAITHVGRPPNRICYEPRYTFAMKFVDRDG